MKTRKRVSYSGRVQGVGFRYTAREIAQHYPIGGWVRNLPDGRVELAAEGAPEDVQRFLDAIGRRMAAYVEDAAITEEAAEGLKEFTIRA